MSNSRDIFALRKAGKLEEALALARTELQASPSDPWVIRGMGWVLHDLIKARQKQGNEAEAATLLTEFRALAIPEEDELLNKCRDGAIGWSIDRKITELVGREQTDLGRLATLLGEYRELAFVEKPGLLHSMILTRVGKVAEAWPGYLEFLQGWGVQNFRPDDFERYKPAGKDTDFDSLVEKVIKSAFKAAKRQHGRVSLSWLADFVGSVIDRFPANKWIPYYYGQLLVWCDRREEARAFVLKVVRQNVSQFWVWQVLAGTYPEQDDMRIACLCRAVLARAEDESFKVNVHAELARTLFTRGMVSESKREWELVEEIRLQKGWGLPVDIRETFSEPWFRETVAAKDNTELYRTYEARAAEAFMEGIPVRDVVLSGLSAADEERGACAYLTWYEGGQQKTARAKVDKNPVLQGLRLGAPLRARVEERDGRGFVLQLEAREGIPWDAIPAHVGVVTHINEEKQLTHVVFGRKEFCLLHREEQPGAKALTVGSFVKLRALYHAEKDRWRAVEVQPSPERPDRAFCREFSGSVEVPADCGFGFAGDVFLPPKVVQRADLKNGDIVQGTAVLSWNEKKKDFGWQAIVAEVGG